MELEPIDETREVFKERSDMERIKDVSSRVIGAGGASTAAFSVFNGINMLGSLPSLPPYNDNQGLTFFTKPFINLSYHNVKGVRKLAYLTDRNPSSMGCAIKSLLTPVPGHHGTPKRFNGDDWNEIDLIRSLMVDDSSCFIPLLGNMCLSLSGWPDFVPDTYTSKEGYNKQQVAWVDGKPNIYNAYDISATFSNMDGDPLYAMMSVWLEYATRVSEGSMYPFPISLVENSVDYQTRIYRIILDKSRRYIQKIFATGASFPTTHPTGAVANFNSDSKISTDNNQLTFQFKSIGFIENDPMLVWSFNETVYKFNPSMRTVESRNDNLKKLSILKVNANGKVISINEKSLFNYKAYPRISEGNELEWWVDKDKYEAITNLINGVHNG